MPAGEPDGPTQAGAGAGRIDGLPDATWTDIRQDEEAILVRRRPAGREEQSYVVVRRARADD